MADVTRILSAIEAGDEQAAAELLPLVYDELRKLAAAKLAHEKPGQTLQATALVHEAYLRLVGGGEVGGQKSEVGGQKANEPTVFPTSDLRPLTSGPAFHSRGHFFAAAAEAMRRILVDQARAKQRDKRGGNWTRVELPENGLAARGDEEVLALDEALRELASEDRLAAQVVDLHHFAGLSHEEVAATLEVTVYQARQKWTYARAWLKDALAKK